MSNIKDFFEKVQSDKAMQEALAQARMDATIAVAGKYGFAITESDFKEMSENISAEELSAVTGGVTAWDGVGWRGMEPSCETTDDSGRGNGKWLTRPGWQAAANGKKAADNERYYGENALVAVVAKGQNRHNWNFKFLAACQTNIINIGSMSIVGAKQKSNKMMGGSYEAAACCFRR